eukprot:TRINITY_DN43476_c0_g1_i2.p2 TRINITY_DN43476_c0_g1~~TRINITY_DN43476_c0_g1_i2.p2  ORF type:complete len:118 (-),score=2.89 TRINITY_DN43476_c0_g1_i2:194-547(-)
MDAFDRGLIVVIPLSISDQRSITNLRRYGSHSSGQSFTHMSISCTHSSVSISPNLAPSCAAVNGRLWFRHAGQNPTPILLHENKSSIRPMLVTKRRKSAGSPCLSPYVLISLSLIHI